MSQEPLLVRLHYYRWWLGTKYRFMDFCTNVWSKAALAHVLGHSFHIGGAVELLLAGVPPKIIAATGGWTSLAFLLYWRRMEEILPMSTSRRITGPMLMSWHWFSKNSMSTTIFLQISWLSMIVPSIYNFIPFCCFVLLSHWFSSSSFHHSLL